MNNRQNEVTSELLMAEAAFLRAFGWRPLAPLSPGGPVSWLPPAYETARSRYSQDDAIKVQKFWSARECARTSKSAETHT